MSWLTVDDPRRSRLNGLGSVKSDATPADPYDPASSPGFEVPATPEQATALRAEADADFRRQHPVQGVRPSYLLSPAEVAARRATEGDPARRGAPGPVPRQKSPVAAEALAQAAKGSRYPVRPLDWKPVALVIGGVTAVLFALSRRRR